MLPDLRLSMDMYIISDCMSYAASLHEFDHNIDCLLRVLIPKLRSVETRSLKLSWKTMHLLVSSQAQVQASLSCEDAPSPGVNSADDTRV
jgi:hypothetical protein